MSRAILIHTEKTGKYLHVGTADIPSGFEGSHAVLPFSQVPAYTTCLESKAGGSKLGWWIDRIGIHHSRPSGCPDEVATPEDTKLLCIGFQTEHTPHFVVLF